MLLLLANSGPNLRCSLSPTSQTSERVVEGPMIAVPLPLLRPQPELKQGLWFVQAGWLMLLSLSRQKNLPKPTSRHQQCAFVEQATVRHRPSRQRSRKAQHHVLFALRNPAEFRIQQNPKRSLCHHPEHSLVSIEARLPNQALGKVILKLGQALTPPPGLRPSQRERGAGAGC